MDRFQKRGLANLIGGTIVFLGGSALTADAVGYIYNSFCAQSLYSPGVYDVFSVMVPAGVATWGAFSPGLIGILSLRGYRFGEKE